MALNQNIIDSFRKAFESDCIRLIVGAYKLAVQEKKYQLDWMENDFSELLGSYVNASDLSLKKRITCKTENKILKTENTLQRGFADKLPRIDFIYSKHWKSQRFECFMEAKRIKEKDSGLKRAYIDEGMDRFVSSKYPLGCMLGYLIDGLITETITGINTLLVKDNRHSETLNERTVELHHAYYESNHNQIGILKHLIFDFTNETPTF